MTRKQQTSISEKRRIQNREAQRTFRKRRAQSPSSKPTTGKALTQASADSPPQVPNATEDIEEVIQNPKSPLTSAEIRWIPQIFCSKSNTYWLVSFSLPEQAQPIVLQQHTASDLASDLAPVILDKSFTMETLGLIHGDPSALTELAPSYLPSGAELWNHNHPL